MEARDGSEREGETCLQLPQPARFSPYFGALEAWMVTRERGGFVEGKMTESATATYSHLHYLKQTLSEKKRSSLDPTKAKPKRGKTDYYFTAMGSGTDFPKQVAVPPCILGGSLLLLQQKNGNVFKVSGQVKQTAFLCSEPSSKRIPQSLPVPLLVQVERQLDIGNVVMHAQFFLSGNCIPQSI